MGTLIKLQYLYIVHIEMKLLSLVVLFSCNIVFSSCLIDLDWETLKNEVTLRYFSPDYYFPSVDADEIWYGMGMNISCTVQDENTVSVTAPTDGFKSNLPFKVFTHGFSSRIIGEDKTAFVDAWMSHYEKEASVILVDWHNLASFTGFDDWNNYAYDYSARNCIDVGEFVGLCLAELAKQNSINANQFHLVGHSLGSHVMGKAGRSFAASFGENVGRISGLDPAGPRFVDGPYLDAIPELADNILTKESADYVDVIHTNGGFEPCVVCTNFRSGTILHIGHVDFYPDGGSVQSGCLFGIDARPGGLCSHRRAVYYYYHSIREPGLFPSLACPSVEECNQEQASGDQVVAYIGEQSYNYWDGSEGSPYYHDLEYCHWSYTEHSNWMCL